MESKNNWIHSKPRQLSQLPLHTTSQALQRPKRFPNLRGKSDARKRPDPFQQLLSALAVPEKAVRQCQQARSLNQQPGRMGVALALEVSNFLNRHHPESLKNHAKDLRRSLEQLAKAKEWNTEPFNGLERTIHDKIIARYQASNAKFCCHFWPETTWDELYPKDHRHAKPQSTTHSETTTAELAACRQKVIADTLSPEIVAKLPQ